MEHKTGQRVALVILLFVGVLTVAVGFIRIRAHIAEPFALKISKASPTDANPLASDTKEDPVALKARDTDGDELSDFDELYVHRTSPYLKDTDSDGYDDKTELDSGNDPNCATGKVCFDSLASTVPQGQEQQASDSSVSAPLPSAVQADLEKLQRLTPPQVRALLLEKGFTEEQLKDIDDETLVSMYRESLLEAAKREQQSGQAVPTQPGAATPAAPQVTPQDFAALSKEQIITLLKDTGELTTEQLAGLEKLDEKTVRSLFMQSLQNAQNTIDAAKEQ